MNLTLNIKGITGYPTPNAINTSGVSIVIDGNLFSTVDTATQIVTNNSIIYVLVSKPGYHAYSNFIQVFDYDMSIDIILVPIITDAGDPDYRKPYPFFHTYIKPCTFSVYVLDTSSVSYGTYSYYLDNIKDETSVSRDTIFNIGEAGTFNIKQSIEVLSLGSNPSTLWDLSINTNITIEEYRPELSISINTNAAIEGSTVETVVGVEFEVIPEFQMNNTLDISCSEGEIKYTLYNISQEEIETTTYPISLTSLPNPEDIKFVHTPAEKGDYRLVVELSNCCTTTVIEKIIGATQFITLVSDGHTHTIHNLSLTKPIQISLYDKDNILALETDKYPVTVNPNSSYDVILKEDGVYIIRILDILETQEYNFIVFDYSDLRACIESIMKSVLCDADGGCCDGCNEHDKDILNKIIALGSLYFSYLEQVYKFNNIYQALTNTELQLMFKVDSVFTALKKYCNCNVTSNLGGCSSC